ncbi:nuclear transport factor 2 family protein [Acaryochloris sp. CCMEE 5410]|uniref:nuclear transport factor 2 family protein n=1 Tax=Acaryochloris sp. CCMEE 5410 TaxID=310037 RepID=UPI0002484FE3|nr:nuclear transport factor 2 family protein [Acaryochloris sp. CCMEE 5410]KAI9134221.1 nuclear transport factor 2 family protein [Acaryochloris sp. CCMEE 5410]
MSTEQNKQIVDKFFEKFSAADVAGALELLDDAAIWRAMGREGGLPMSGEMDKPMIGELIENVKSAFPDGMRLTPTGWTAEGDRVALEMESYAVKSNGIVYNNFHHFLVALSNGKITSLREYLDTLHVKQVFIDN